MHTTVAEEENKHDSQGEKPADDWVNPIDPDKVTENPHNLPYAHTAGGALVKPEDKGKIHGRAVAAMEQQTSMQLDQIKQQMELLAKQASDLQSRVEISNRIYEADMNFEPLVGHTYHLYQKENGRYVLSMIGPNEWGKSPKYSQFIASASLLADHTWQVLEQDENGF